MTKFVLLRNKDFGNVYWTTNSPFKLDNVDVLFESDSQEEMIKEWQKYHLTNL